MLSNKISSKEIEAIGKMFETCRNVVIVTHTSADGDAIGSSLGLREYLIKKGKQVTVIVPNYYPDFLKWMKDTDKILMYSYHVKTAKMYIEHADLICVLDLNETKRMDDMGEVVKAAKAKKVMIDHHLFPEKFCDITISYPLASSTCELVFRIINSLGGTQAITKAGAEDLFAGICTDTGKLSFNSNDPDLYQIVGELLKKGINKDQIIRNIYSNYTEGRFRLLGYILYEKMKLYADYNAAIYTLTKEELSRFHYLKGDTEGIVNMPLDIKGIRLSIALREDTEKPRILVSLRSVGDFPANKMAEDFFNGGGHKNAAGGTLFCTMNEAIATAEHAIEAYKQNLIDNY